MRWSEPVTIYLAAGASFGVSRYLCAESCTKNRQRATLEGLAATLLWPLVAAAILFKHLRHGKEDEATGELEARVQVRVEEAERALVISINKMLDAVRRVRNLEREGIEQTLYALREGAEQYVGLAGLEAEADVYAAPAAYEMELARVSGRRGKDVLLAGRCVHRRNVSRIKARYESERARLLRKLAALRASDGNSPASNPADADSDERGAMSEARLEIYTRATDLFSLLEDEGAARSTAQLVDAECSYLRRLRKANGQAENAPAPGEERCTAHKPPLIYKDPLRATTFTQG